MVQVHRVQRSWLRWCVAGFVALVALLEWWMGSSTPMWYWFGLYAVLWSQSETYILVDGVLVTSQVGLSMHSLPVPLAKAEMIGRERAWYLRWQAGKIRRRLSLNAIAPQFREQIAQAIEAARAADPETVPQTEREAGAAVVLSREYGVAVKELLYVFGMVALLLLLFWLRQPLVMLLLPVAILYRDRILGVRLLLLSTEHLWVLPPDGEPYGIPLSHVRQVKAGVQRVQVTTDDPTYPRIEFMVGGPMTMALQRRLGGEPVLVRRQAEPVSSTGPEPLRCSLCGRPEPGAVKTGAVYICDHCSGKARYEASEAGHGLNPREPKPM